MTGTGRLKACDMFLSFCVYSEIWVIGCGVFVYMNACLRATQQMKLLVIFILLILPPGLGQSQLLRQRVTL